MDDPRDCHPCPLGIDNEVRAEVRLRQGQTNLVVSIAIISVCVFVAAVVSKNAGSIEAIYSEVTSVRSDLTSRTKDRIHRSELEMWMHRLQKRNPDIDVPALGDPLP